MKSVFLITGCREHTECTFGILTAKWRLINTAIETKLKE